MKTHHFAAGVAVGLIIGAVTGGGVMKAVSEKSPEAAARTAGTAHAGSRGEDRPPPSRRLSTADRQAVENAIRPESVRAALRESDPLDRLRGFAEVLGGMTAENAPVIRQALVDLAKDGEFHNDEWKLMWMQWARIDPVSAITTLVRERETGEVPGYASQLIPTSQALFEAWAKRDPIAAGEHLPQVTDEILLSSGFVGLLEGMTLAEATDYANRSEINDGHIYRQSAEILTQRSLREAGSVDGMKAWYDTIPSAQMKQEALGHVCYRLRKDNLNAAAEWLQAQGDAGVNITQIASDLADEYAEKDAGRGLTWYAALPEQFRNPHTEAQLRSLTGQQ